MISLLTKQTVVFVDVFLYRYCLLGQGLQGWSFSGRVRCTMCLPPGKLSCQQEPLILPRSSCYPGLALKTIFRIFRCFRKSVDSISSLHTVVKTLSNEITKSFFLYIVTSLRSVNNPINEGTDDDVHNEISKLRVRSLFIKLCITLFYNTTTNPPS